MKTPRTLLVALAVAVAVVSLAAPGGFTPGSTQISVFSDRNRDW